MIMTNPIVISKRDVTTSKELPGAELIVKDSTGRVVDEWVSEAKPHYIEGLADGIYTLIEITAPAGYKIAEKISFPITDGKIDDSYLLVMNDELEEEPKPESPSNASFSKQDAATGKELLGAKLQIIDSDGEIVEEWISGNKPHEVPDLPDGEYILREITAPDGYETAEEISFEIEDGKIVGNPVVMKDKPQKATTPETERPVVDDGNDGGSGGGGGGKNTPGGSGNSTGGPGVKKEMIPASVPETVWDDKNMGRIDASRDEQLIGDGSGSFRRLPKTGDFSFG
jgi:uncharacterized surface anchored protein